MIHTASDGVVAFRAIDASCFGPDAGAVAADEGAAMVERFVTTRP